MNYSKLSYEQLEDLANQLNQASQSMASILEDVKNLFAKIGDTDAWEGTSATTVKAKFDELSAKFPNFSEAVKDCYTYINSVVENYKSVDTSVSNM